MTKKYEKFLKPSMRYIMRRIVNEAGISCGKPSDRTLMNRFYQAKEKVKAKKKETYDYYVWFDNSESAYKYSETIDEIGNKLDSNANLLRRIEEVESLLFEEEILLGD